MGKLDEKKIRTLVSTALTFGIVWMYAQIILSFSVFNPVSHVMKDYSITDFYYQVLNMREERDTSRIVTIVDMDSLRNRADIAYVLEEILEQEPKVVGVDIKFEGLKPEQPFGDSLIMDVARNNSNIVFALELIDDSYDGSSYNEVRHSFFADSLPDVKEGIVSIPFDQYGGQKRYIEIGKKVKGQMMPSIVKRLSDEYAEEEIMPLADKTLKINWSPIDFRVIPYDSVSYYSEYFADRIVLFGSVKDDVDMHLTPQGRIPGIKLLGYGIETMLKQNSIEEVPTWILWIVSYLVVLFTRLIFERYDFFVKQRKSAMLKIVLKTSIIKGLIKFFWMAAIMYIGYLLFIKYHLSINLAAASAATAFTSMADDLYDVAYNSIFKRKDNV